VTYVYDAFGKPHRTRCLGRIDLDRRAVRPGRLGSGQAEAVGNENFDAWADLDSSNVLVTRRVYSPGFDEINGAGSRQGARWAGT